MKEVDFYACDICSCLEELKRMAEECGEDCRLRFNNSYLLSTDSIDEAYLRIVGMTKAEHDAFRQKKQEERERELAEHKARIPKLTEKYRNEARGLVIDSELEFWDKIVPIRLGDLYRGMELQQVLDCCKIMRDESLVFTERLEKAYDVFMNAGHSGMSAGLTMSMLRRFCPDGDILADACRDFRFGKK